MIKIPPCKNCGHSGEDHVELLMRFNDGTTQTLDKDMCRYMCGCKGYKRDD